MSGRMTLGSLFVLAALIPGLCHAQGGYGYGPATQPGAWQGQPPQTPYPASPQYPGCGAPPQGPSNTIYEQLPDDLGFMHQDSPLEDALKNLFRHSYYRGEYLLWSASRPGNVLLGNVPPAGFLQQQPFSPILNPNTFDVSDPLGNPATAVEPSLYAFDVKNLSGYRGTAGFNIGPGNFELSAFVLARRKNEFDGSALMTAAIPDTPTTIGVPANYIAQSITIDGAAGTLLYTTGYIAIMQTSIWGAEANYILDAPNAGTGDWWTFSPIAGFRYFNYLESLNQFGGYDYVPDPTQPTTTAQALRSIYSRSNNNVYGPQIGMRAELSISKVTFGAEPKIMLGLNSYTDKMSTLNVNDPALTPNDNTVYNFQKTATVFSPMADLRAYTRIQVSQYAHVYAAYNLMWVGSISRPYDTVGYNMLSGGGGMFSPKFTDSIIQGLSVGAELRF